MLKQNDDGTIVDLSPKIVLVERNLLEWRKPSDHPCDTEDAILVAHGFGGRYAIGKDSGEFLLWMDDDEFVWKKFETIEKCQRYAECRFERVVRKLYSKLKGADNEEVLILERDQAEDAADKLASLVLGEPIDWPFHDEAWKRAIDKLKSA